jgi:hypothetical protein
MSMDADLRLDLQDLVNNALAHGMPQMAGLGGANYILAQIEKGNCRDKKEMARMWAAFCDGFLTNMQMDGKYKPKQVADGN